LPKVKRQKKNLTQLAVVENLGHRNMWMPYFNLGLR